MTSSVLLLATLETKNEEARYLAQCLQDHDVSVQILDLSLDAGGKILDGPAKTRAIDETSTKALGQVADALDQGTDAVIGLGGGTSGEIILKVLRTLPITFAKVLVTTLPFDPRTAIADNSIILVPTLVDICGLNATLREVLENAAAMMAGICYSRRKAGSCVEYPSIGLTALGATEGAVGPLITSLKKRGQEATVFHANGYGGAAFSRFARIGAFHAIIDLTPHEMTRLHLAGAHVPMPDRFTAASALPRIVLPGALNFIGFGERSLVPPAYLTRPHYEHSGFFTHVQLTPDEMRQMAEKLASALNVCTGPRALIVPMGGFSHQDRPGGIIESEELRAVFLSVMQEMLCDEVTVHIRKEHIADQAIIACIIDTLDHLISIESSNNQTVKRRL
ncbi:MAG: Tm-1-like ATP-binding domain-containing protein [Pseudomonadota bacterium]